MLRFATVLAVGVALAAAIPAAWAQESCYTLSCSPTNWDNSDANGENSSAIWRNSPANPKNTPLEPQAGRGIYDSDGNWRGYAVPKPGGGVSIFDESGNRDGYTTGDDDR